MTLYYQSLGELLIFHFKKNSAQVEGEFRDVPFKPEVAEVTQGVNGLQLCPRR
jgi:hypothetical protein